MHAEAVLGIPGIRVARHVVVKGLERGLGRECKVEDVELNGNGDGRGGNGEGEGGGVLT